MRNYLIRRVLLLVPTVLIVCVIVASLIEFIPGDAALARLNEIGDATPETIDALRARLGIDRPFFVRLGEWFGDLFQGDLGRSLWTLEPATKQLWSAIPVSLELVLGGMLIGLLAGIPLGVISAMKQDKPIDTGARFLSVIGLAVPDFFIGTMVILYASLWFGYFSAGYTPFVDDPLRNLEQFSIPMAILGIRLVAATARMTRSTLLEVMREDYVRTARSKGLSERVVFYRHALRNAVLPVITLVGTNLGFLLGGDRHIGDHLLAARSGQSGLRLNLPARLHSTPGGGVVPRARPRPHELDHRSLLHLARSAGPLRMTSLNSMGNGATWWGTAARWTLALGRFARRHPIGAFSMFVILLMAFAAVFANLVSTHDAFDISRDTLEGPSWSHFFGTDGIGRDTFSRIIHGSRTSLQVGILSVLISTGAGAVIGLVSGYMGGAFDLVVQRIVDGVQALPGLVLALALVAALEPPSSTDSVIAISIVATPANSRVVRSAVLSAKENTYIEAARAIGCSGPRIVLRHILPNIVAPIIILASLGFGYAILVEASLSFLGLGTPPPTPTWGGMLKLSQTFLEQAPYLALFPGLAITIAVLAFNLAGDTIRDVLDPRLRGA